MKNEDLGFVCLFRSFLEWGWYTDINTKVLFIHMLLRANWKEGNFKGTTVPRGSFVSSIAKLAEETGLTSDEVRTAISHLIQTREITKQSTNKYTVFTVVNYTLYQEITKQTTSTAQSIPVLFPTIEQSNKGTKKQDLRNIENDISCPEPDKPIPDLSGILLPLNDKTSYNVPLDKITLWRNTYPAVDVEQELRRMIAWLDSNPTKRKTRRGIDRFINNWLARTQDSGGSKGQKEVRETVGNNAYDTNARREQLARAFAETGDRFGERDDVPFK